MRKIGVLKETNGDNRVALLPAMVKDLIDLKIEVLVEEKSGEKAFAFDTDYAEVGAIVTNKEDVLKKSDILVKVNGPAEDELDQLTEGKIWISMLDPFVQVSRVKSLLNRCITSFALELIPRTTRAQAMDVLSSMGTISGYMAVMDAARQLPKFFPMFMSAAGTVRPARVLILGAGVAGLQAIAISRKLGAVVEVFDVRSAVKEEVLSLGGKFIEIEGALENQAAGGYAVEQSEEYKKKQQEAIHDHAIAANVVICTAQIPGKRAPVLLKKETVQKMLPGAVIIDLAAATGGNCELTRNDEINIVNHVKIIGKTNYPSEMASDASMMFGKNVFNFIKLMIDENGQLNIDFNDEIMKGACASHQNKIVNERLKEFMKIS